MSDNFDNLLNSKSQASTVRTRPKSFFRRAFLTLLIVFLVLAILVCGAAVWGYTISVKEVNLPNVYVDGIFVGNMTAEETSAALSAANWDAYEGAGLKVSLPAGAEFSVDYLRSGAVLSRADAVSAAHAYGHDGDVFGNLRRWLANHISAVDVMSEERTLDSDYIRTCMNQGLSALTGNLQKTPFSVDQANAKLTLFKGAGGVELDTEALYDAIVSALRAGEQNIRFDKLLREPDLPDFGTLHDKLCVEPASAYYNEYFEVVPEVIGCDFSIEHAVALWNAAGIGEQVVIPLTMTQPEYTAEQLQALLFRDLLGAQMTYYTGSTAERINNIRLAAAKLDGLVLLPGETFSYNEALGQRTAEAGFQIAKAYSDGQEVDSLGGGICQVSSTLYSATLYARLKTVSRTNHYFKVGYIDYGMDATVSWGQPDFKFRNNKDFPIKIAAYLNEEEGSVVVEIWGTDMEGIKVSLHHTDEPIYDEDFTDVQTGYSVKTYSDLYDLDGNYLETVYVNSSVYYFHDEDIEWPEGYEKHLSDAFLDYYTPT